MVARRTPFRFERVIELKEPTGKVFRVSPNELSFASVKSWKAIYGPWPGQLPFVKSNFYDIYGAGFNSRCIGSERDPAEHAQMKRFLAPAFSTKALSEQEDIVQSCVDAFVAKLETAGGTKAGLNMTIWYEMVAFDIRGENGLDPCRSERAPSIRL